MLFDLSSGKRKRVVQVVYATLALLMGGSLVLFGIGSDAPGGILDAVGLGSNSDDSGDVSSQFEEQIGNAEEKLETDPTNAAALLNLTRYEFLSANSQITQNPETGAIDIPPEAQSQLERSVDAWQRYLDTDPAKPDPSAAQNVASAYQYIGDAGAAAEAQQIVVDDDPSEVNLGLLAYFLYFDLQFKRADEVAKQTLAASDASARKTVQQRLDFYRSQAEQLQKQVDKAREEGGKDEAEQQLQDPFGSLGGSTSELAPTTPTP
jgi:tetratricopeptide (TPR) repeat protein